MKNVVKVMSVIRKYVTVEPIELLYCLMYTSSSVLRDNLYQDKVCVLDEKFDEDVCANLTSGGEVNDTVRKKVQARVAELEGWDGIIANVFPLVICLFMGAWSDIYGRKLLLILPMIGNVLNYVILIVNHYFFRSLAPIHLLWASAAYATFGSYQCLNIGLYGYISDVTTEVTRTTRLSILNGVFSSSYVIGTQVGVLIYSQWGNDYYTAFGFSMTLALLSIFYTIFFVKESITPLENQANYHDKSHHRLTLSKIFDISNMVTSLKTAFKRRNNAKRRKILLLIVLFNICMFCLNTTRFNYLLLGLRLDWSLTEFSNYLTVQRSARLISLLVLLPAISSSGWLIQLSDPILTVFCSMATFAAYLMLSLANVDWLVYVSAALHLNSMMTVLLRSQLSKSVDPDEKGRIFAVLALGQAIVPIVANPLFGYIYKFTVHTSLPGAYLLLVSFLLAAGIFITLYILYRWNVSDSIDLIVVDEEVNLNKCDVYIENVAPVNDSR